MKCRSKLATATEDHTLRPLVPTGHCCCVMPSSKHGPEGHSDHTLGQVVVLKYNQVFGG